MPLQVVGSGVAELAAGALCGAGAGLGILAACGLIYRDRPDADRSTGSITQLNMPLPG